MKQKKYLLVLFLILAFNSFSFAQNPGFEGKTVSAYYDLSSSFGFISESVAYNTANKKDNFIVNKIRHQHNLELEFAVNRSLSFGLSYFNFRTGYSQPELRYQGKKVYSNNITQHGFGFFTRFYKVSLRGSNYDQGALAPIGYYISPAAFASFDTYETKANKQFYNKNQTVFYSRKSMHYGVQVRVGRHIPIAKNVLLDLGAGFGGFLDNKLDQSQNFEFDSPYTAITFHHIATFYIGVGYALF